jgi:hypothetical protein
MRKRRDRPSTTAAVFGALFRVEVDVPGAFSKIVAVLDEDGLVSSLPEMPDPSVSEVESVRVLPAQLLHPAGQFPDRSRQENVIVVGHQAVGVDLQRACLHKVAETREEDPAILVIQERRHSRHATRHDVAAGASKFDLHGSAQFLLPRVARRSTNK